MSGIIIYKGKYGAKKQYAGWLGQQLNLPAAASDEVTKGEFRLCDFNCQWYFLPGKIIHATLSVRDRLILKLARRFEKDPLRRRALFEDISAIKKEELLPLINAVKKYITEKALIYS
jgi:hypothetical protein